MIRLSKRLEWIAQEVPQGGRLADIGSDHALLPTYLAERGRIAGAIAGEVNEGPYEAAGKQVRMAGLQHMIDVRLGDGLAVLKPGEADVITIAGMGGALISSILEAGKSKLIGVKRLVLQPNVGEAAVREWLEANGWLLIGERILEEDGKIYEILTAEPAEDEKRSAAAMYEPFQAGELTLGRHRQLLMGPYLMREASPVWKTKWELELEKLEHVCTQLGRSEQEASMRKASELREEMTRIREVLAACSPKDKL